MNSRTHFIVTGHIDHGKSTFIGRLLLEMGAIPRDRFEYLKAAAGDSRIEYSHLTDSLRDEKTRGITIGVSQTIFSYKKRDFVFIDAPGHHEFLQNMITGASRADIAFLIVDAVEGVRESTLRHLNMLTFLGISEIVVIINKMDLVDFSEDIFNKIKNEIKNCFERLGLKFNSVIPVSAYHSENLTGRSNKTPWYKGPIVTEILYENSNSIITVKPDTNFRFIVQDVYDKTVVGELLGGQLDDKTEYTVHQSKTKFKIGIDPSHFKGKKIQSFILENAKSVINRGDILLRKDDEISNSKNLRANLIWFGSENLDLGSDLRLRLAKQEVCVRIEKISSLIDSSTLAEVSPESEIKKGSLLKCEIVAEKEISFDLFENDGDLGRFVLLKNGLISGAGKVI